VVVAAQTLWSVDVNGIVLGVDCVSPRCCADAGPMAPRVISTATPPPTNGERERLRSDMSFSK